MKQCLVEKIFTMIYNLTNILMKARCSKFKKLTNLKNNIFSLIIFISLVFANANYRFVTRRITSLVSKRDKRGQPFQLFAQQLTFPQSTNKPRAPCASVIASLWHADENFLSMYTSLHENHIKGQCRLEIKLQKCIYKFLS